MSCLIQKGSSLRGVGWLVVNETHPEGGGSSRFLEHFFCLLPSSMPFYFSSQLTFYIQMNENESFRLRNECK